MLSSTKTEASIEIQYECEECKDQEGWFFRNESEIEYWKDCGCILRKRVEQIMQTSHISEEFQKKTFENFIQDGRPEVIIQAFKMARLYVKSFDEIKKTRKNSAALLGRPGCGKTHLLMAISNSLISRGVEVVYFPWVEGFNELKSDFDRMDVRMNRLQRAEVLYIDDMFKGRDKPTEFQKEQLFAIINYRYLENKPILVSSEKSIAEMCSFDEAIGSRINEMCQDYKVTLSGGIELNYRLVH